MLISRIGYFSKEAWAGLKRGGIMAIIATSTIAISLFVLGVFLLIFFNLYNLLHSLNSKLDIVAYVKPGVQDTEINKLNLSVARIPGVKQISFISKERAWQEFRETHTNLGLEEFLDENPLPDSFKVEVKELSYIKIVANKLRKLESVEEVRFGGDIAEKVAKFIKIISSVGFIIVLLLSLSTIMIVINTIRLTVIARESEINIMSLVGADRSFIKVPFIFEGIFLGLLGSFIALSGLKIGYDIAAINIEKSIPFMPINLNVSEINLIFGIVILTGIFLGWIGGYVSVSKSLKPD